ncbi:MAG TPA: PIG-L family deacetylase [Chloroflexota bacterium]|nr:PIG-L family deacetylase [Chloroflexota bacterium]HUM67978.1 PIG-L family deacetylase [Chloroflexota bacterium]
MLNIQFSFPPDTNPQILCLGAHSDDIEIGCGGTILRLIEEYPNLSVYWIVFSASESRKQEAVASAHQFLEKAAHKEIVVKDFRDGFFPYMGAEIKGYFEELKQTTAPDLIFTHYRHDLHQDHRLLNELTWNTFRHHLVLEYEIPKYDGDLGTPNVFVPLSQQIGTYKITCLLQHFQTQTNKHWFTDRLFESIMALRGIESRAPDGYAEAFYGRKIVL